MFRITHSLISAWDYATGEYATDNSLDEFMATLRREPHERSKSMQIGVDFESEVTYYAANGQLQKSDADYADAERAAIVGFGSRVRNSVPQVRAEKRMKIGGMDFQLVGVADYLKAGIIYDTKRVGRYEYGKYVSSSQHPMYFELFPEAIRFDYLIFDGGQTYTETFRRGECTPASILISRFIRDMRDAGLIDTYKQYWEV